MRLENQPDNAGPCDQVKNVGLSMTNKKLLLAQDKGTL